MIRRVATVGDPTLAIGRASLVVKSAPVITAAPPVVMPKRRVEVEPELPFAEVPVVRKGGVSEAAAAVPSAAAVTLLDRPPEQVPTGDHATLFTKPFEFLTGAAGCGKSYLARQKAAEDRSVLLCATTGIAAVNLTGETINSVLGYFDTASLQESYINGQLTARFGKLWKAGIKRLNIDEVSMLAADQLGFLVKAVEEVNGYGYVLGKRDEDDEQAPPAMGLTLVGDFLQLAPVKAEYAFTSPEWQRFAGNTITLTEIRRQSDPDFIAMLRAARAGHGEIVAEYFAGRNAIHQETDDRFAGSTILAKNDSVDRYNELRMAQLPGAVVTFPSTRWGKQRSEWGVPTKPPQTWGIPEVLTLKVGALVMVLNNQRDELKRLIYVNGDLGEIVDSQDGVAYVALQRTGEIVAVLPVTRQVKVPIDSTRRAELRKEGKADRIDGKWEITGEITYMPLRVAYASTVHKSQGLSLDSVQVNLRDHFFKSPGMLYVALSRARTAEGLRLVGSPQAIIDRCSTDPRLKAWL